MKKSILVSSLIAAASMLVVPAFAGTTVGTDTYSGTIYTWLGASANFSAGKFSVSTYDGTNWSYGASATPGWSATWSTGNTGEYNTLRYVAAGSVLTTAGTVGTSSGNGYDFTPIKIGGLLVESGATGWSLSSNGTSSTRNMELGKAGSTSLFTINEDFSISPVGSTSTTNTFAGTQNWVIASGKTLTFTSGRTNTISAEMNITGGGTFALGSGTTVSGAGTIKLDNATLSGGTYGAGLTIAANGANAIISGTTINGATIDASTNSITSASALTLTSGTAKVSTTTSIEAGTNNVTIGSGFVFDLIGTTAGSAVSVISTSGTISGWTTLTNSNFKLNGTMLGGRDTVDVSTAGQVTYTSGAVYDLTWTGVSGDTWAVGSTTWTRDVSGVATAADFQSADSVTFGALTADQTITVATTVSPVAFVVDAGAGKTYTFSGAGTIAATSISVNSGTMSLDGVGVSGAISVGAAGTIHATNANALGAGAITGSGRIESVGAKISNTNGLSAAGWTGTVALIDNQYNGLNVSDLGNSNSAVELSGINGYFNGASYSTSMNLNLVNSTTIGKEYAFNGSDGYSSGTWTFSGKITGDGTLKHTSSTTQTYKFTGDFSGYTGEIALGAGRLEFSNATDIAFTGKISSTGAFTKSGAGTLTLSGANTYTGGTTISAGKVIANNASALGTGAVNLTGGTLELSNDLSIGSLSGAAGTIINLKSSTLTVNQTANGTYAGTITNDSGTLIKTGAADLTLTSANTYTSTQVDGGRLIIQNNQALGSGTVTIGATGTLVVNTTGTVANAIDNTAGGTLAVDSTGTVTLSGVVTGDVTVTNAAELIIDNAGSVVTVANTNGAKISVENGTLKLSGSSPITSQIVIASGSTFNADTAITMNANIVLQLSDADLDGESTAAGMLKGTQSNVTFGTGFGFVIDTSNLTGTYDDEEIFQLVVSGFEANWDFDADTLKVGQLLSDGTFVEGDWSFVGFDQGNGKLTLSSVPEPSLFGSIAGLVALALVGTRRRRNTKKA